MKLWQGFLAAGFALLVPWILWQWNWACLLGLALIFTGVAMSGPDDHAPA